MKLIRQRGEKNTENKIKNTLLNTAENVILNGMEWSSCKTAPYWAK